MSDYFIPRDYSLREQDLIPEDDRPCAYRLPESVDDLECWSGNCTCAAAELEWARQHLGISSRSPMTNHPQPLSALTADSSMSPITDGPVDGPV